MDLLIPVDLLVPALDPLVPALDPLSPAVGPCPLLSFGALLPWDEPGLCLWSSSAEQAGSPRVGRVGALPVLAAPPQIPWEWQGQSAGRWHIRPLPCGSARGEGCSWLCLPG